MVQVPFGTHPVKRQFGQHTAEFTDRRQGEQVGAAGLVARPGQRDVRIEAVVLVVGDVVEAVAPQLTHPRRVVGIGIVEDRRPAAPRPAHAPRAGRGAAVPPRRPPPAVRRETRRSGRRTPRGRPRGCAGTPSPSPATGPTVAAASASAAPTSGTSSSSTAIMKIDTCGSHGPSRLPGEVRTESEARAAVRLHGVGQLVAAVDGQPAQRRGRMKTTSSVTRVIGLLSQEETR